MPPDSASFKYFNTPANVEVPPWLGNFTLRARYAFPSFRSSRIFVLTKPDTQVRH